MANKLKLNVEKKEINETKSVKNTTETKKPKKKSKLVYSLNLIFSGTFLGNESILKHVPFVLFLATLGILYIANGYWADEKLIHVNKLNAQLKELRTEFIATKSELMFTSKQSEVAKAVEKSGLKEPLTPPMKITSSDTLPLTEKP